MSTEKDQLLFRVVTTADVPSLVNAVTIFSNPPARSTEDFRTEGEFRRFGLDWDHFYPTTFVEASDRIANPNSLWEVRAALDRKDVYSARARNISEALSRLGYPSHAFFHPIPVLRLKDKISPITPPETLHFYRG